MGWWPSLRRLWEAERTVCPSPERTGSPPSAILKRNKKIIMKEIFALRCHIFIVFLSKLLGEAGRRIAGPPSLAHQPLGGGLTPPPLRRPIAGGHLAFTRRGLRPPLPSCARHLRHATTKWILPTWVTFRVGLASESHWMCWYSPFTCGPHQ